MKRYAFTLAEILITLAIIGIVVATLLPSFVSKDIPWDLIIAVIVVAALIVPAMIEEAKRNARHRSNFSKRDRVAKAKKTTLKNDFEDVVDSESWFTRPKMKNFNFSHFLISPI